MTAPTRPSPWYSTPASARKAKPRNLTLTPEASAALDALTSRPGGDNASREASASILDRARRLGVWPAAATAGDAAVDATGPGCAGSTCSGCGTCEPEEPRA